MPTSLRDQIASDFLSFDGLETISYQSRLDEDGAFADGVSVQALGTRGEELSEADIALIGAARRTQVWHFLVADLEQYYSGNAGVAKVRDKLTDESGQVWIVWRVQKQSLGVRYRLSCIEATGE